jgi:anti-sigma B factor antagonist
MRSSVEFQVVTVELGDGLAAASVVGEADLYTAPKLKEALNGLVDGGAQSLLVDLSRTSFLDSTTLGVLMGVVRKLRSRGGELVIACGDPNIRKIFEITLLDRIFAIYDSTDAGMAHLRRAGTGAAEPPSQLSRAEG